MTSDQKERVVAVARHLYAEPLTVAIEEAPLVREMGDDCFWVAAWVCVPRQHLDESETPQGGGLHS